MFFFLFRFMKIIILLLKNGIFYYKIPFRPINTQQCVSKPHFPYLKPDPVIINAKLILECGRSLSRLHTHPSALGKRT